MLSLIELKSIKWMKTAVAIAKDTNKFLKVCVENSTIYKRHQSKLASSLFS